MAIKYKKICVKEETYQLFKQCYDEFFKENPACLIFKNKVNEDDMIKRICEYYLTQ